jgi:hypothetical protein
MCETRSEKSARVAADLAGTARGLSLKPADELLKSKLLRKVVAGASGRRSSSRSAGDGSSNRRSNRNGGVGAGYGRGRNDRRSRARRCRRVGRSGAGAGAKERRTGDRVVDGGGVGVEEDAGIVALV